MFLYILGSLKVTLLSILPNQSYHSFPTKSSQLKQSNSKLKPFYISKITHGLPMMYMYLSINVDLM